VPAYLIVHAERRREDILADTHGIALALPTEHVACIQRVDEPQESAPQKE